MDGLTWSGLPEGVGGMWGGPDGDTPSDDLERTDMTILGIPYDAGATASPGQSEAPFRIRHLEAMATWHTHDLGDLSTVKAIDVGDIHVDRRWPVQSLKNSGSYINHLARTTNCLVTLGGDHSISYHVIGQLPTRPIVIHLDAHTDTWDHEAPDWMKDPYPTHASWVSKVQDDNLADQIYQLGIRAVVPPDESTKGIMRWPGHFPDKRLTNFIKYLKTKHPGDPHIYLSVDMDVVDPAFCPGVAYPEPGGWTPNMLLNVIEKLAATGRVRGVDIVETTPALDRDNMSVRLAHRSVLAVMRGIKRAL